MKIKLIAGDHEWTLDGTHVCDEHGIAKVLEADVEIDLSDDVVSRIMPIIEYGRVARGLMPDGSLPPTPQPEEVIEPVIPEQDQQTDAAVLQAVRPRKKKEV